MIDWIITPILFSPLIWELFNDKQGDIHPNNDWMMRGIMMVASATLVSLFGTKGFFPALGLSLGIFFLLFDYLINIVNGKKQWWSALSPTAIPDKWEYWAATPWYSRLLIRIIVFGTAFSIYFWEEMMIWNYPYGQ